MRRISLVILILSLFTFSSLQAQSSHVVIYATEGGTIVALDSQTAQQTPLLQIDSPLPRAYRFFVSPDGAHLAVFVRFTDEGSAERPFQYHLYVVRIGDAALLLDQDMLPPDYVYPSEETLGDPKYELTRVLGDGIRWSPEGRYLAFISAQMGNADVFIFEPAAQTLVQLSETPDTAAFISWNPSGTTLVYSDLYSFGTGSGYQINAHFAVSVPGGDTRPIPLPELVNRGGISIIGWVDDRTLIYSPLDFAFFGAAGLYTLDLTSLESTELLPPRVAMTVPVYDSGTRTIAFVVPEIGEVSLVPGAYLWRVGEGSPTLIQSGAFYAVQNVRPGYFQYENPSGSFLLNTADGVLMPLPSNDFGAFVSPLEDAVVLSRVDGTYISHISADDAALVWNGEIQVPIWSPDGRIFYTYGTVEAGTGLLAVDVMERSIRLVDSHMASISPRATAP